MILVRKGVIPVEVVMMVLQMEVMAVVEVVVAVDAVMPVEIEIVVEMEMDMLIVVEGEVAVIVEMIDECNGNIDSGGWRCGGCGGDDGNLQWW